MDNQIKEIQSEMKVQQCSTLNGIPNKDDDTLRTESSAMLSGLPNTVEEVNNK